MSRIDRARAFRRDVLDQLDNLRLERVTLLEKIQRLKSMTLWAELDSGASIKVGDEVRYFFKTYHCIKAHTKALTRRPTDTEYWVEVPNDLQ